MNEEIYSIISYITNKVEAEIDERLITAYAYVSRRAEYDADEMGIYIDSYELKQLITYSYAIVNREFLAELKQELHGLIVKLSVAEKNDEDVTNIILNSQEELVNMIRSEFKRILSKARINFEDSFYYEYVRERNRQEMRDIERRLTDRLEAELQEIPMVIERIIETELEEVIALYKTSENKQVNEFSQILEKISETYAAEIREDDEVRKIFTTVELLLAIFAKRYDHIDEMTKEESENLATQIQELRQAIIRSHKQQEKPIHTPKHMSNEPIKEERVSKPKHFAKTEDSITEETTESPIDFEEDTIVLYGGNEEDTPTTKRR